MDFEKVTLINLKYFVNLVLELWNDCDFDEEYREYEKLLNLNNHFLYMAKNAYEYIAFIHTSIRNEYVEGAEKLPVAYIEGIYVKPKYQNKGIAKQFVNEAEIWARNQNIEQIASDTDLTNEQSIQFHKKIGFQEVEKVVCFIKDL
ncbi:GNAT family N-acetyltransferase [Myroides odoratimimus]|uniref:aminoglycoside 6'-N-acetyltransferase n=1 Tax=Myroides odoratimimus TaxID=76832 RepID=UPI0025765694|nr:aminoglycoside 6'-N-acetyltransferase [Myroides odoratimimus]MDM1511156.1 GNAT family N-acetyltransferase [Myroides odoratimimus]MDM1514473.1 GNAT family N-acetyltransferase [Myroides odoratimimus]